MTSYIEQEAAEEAWREFERRHPDVPRGKAALTFVQHANELSRMNLDTAIDELAKRTREAFGIAAKAKPKPWEVEHDGMIGGPFDGHPYSEQIVVDPDEGGILLESRRDPGTQAKRWRQRHGREPRYLEFGEDANE